MNLLGYIDPGVTSVLLAPGLLLALLYGGVAFCLLQARRGLGRVAGFFRFRRPSADSQAEHE